MLIQHDRHVESKAAVASKFTWPLWRLRGDFVKDYKVFSLVLDVGVDLDDVAVGIAEEDRSVRPRLVRRPGFQLHALALQRLRALVDLVARDPEGDHRRQ